MTAIAQETHRALADISAGEAGALEELLELREVKVILGFFFPLFWLIGALMAPSEASAAPSTRGTGGA